MAGTKYCMGCMQALSWDGRCRFCDFTEEEYENEEAYLPIHSTLKNGAYLIGRVLGKGGFGITYIGLDTTLLQRVAIKEFYPEHFVRRREQDGSREVVPIQEAQKDSFERGMDSFLQEGRTLAKFGSLSAVAGVKTFLQENGTAYLVMEYVVGMSVKDYVHTYGVMDPDMVLSMMKPVIRDLQCIHEEHIFHRDISADNLIIDTNGKLTLIDFGAAKQILADNERTNTILYKPGYSALEQYSASGKQGAWTDVYGLCASVYYMLTGIVPESAMERVVDDTMQSLCDMESLVLSEENKAAIWRGMSVERKDRYQNMAELYQALFGEQISEALPLTAREGFIPPQKLPHSSREKVLSHTRMKRQLREASRKRQRKKQQRRWMLGLAGGLLIALSVLFWHVLHGGFRLGSGVTRQPSVGAVHSGASAEKTENPMPEVTPTVSQNADQSIDVEKDRNSQWEENQMKKSEEDQGSQQGEDQTEKPKEKQGSQQEEKQTKKPNGEQNSKAKVQQTAEPTSKPKTGQTSKSKAKQTPKPKTKQTPKPDTKEKTPSLRLQEDDHVAGSLE